MPIRSSKNRRSAAIAALRAAFPHTIPVLSGFLFLGIAYGVLMNTRGYGPGWSALMSAVAFGGSMQFVAVSLLTAAFDPAQAFFLACMVNARHIFYGLSMLEKYRGLGPARVPLIYTLCDETFSLLSSVDPPEGVDRAYFYLSVSLLDYCYWLAATALGGLLGNILPFNAEGLDFALTALFVVLFLEQWKKRENRPAGIVGVCSAAVCLAVFGADDLVLPAMALITILLLLGRKKQCT